MHGPQPLSFEVQKTDGTARAGVLTVRGIAVQTPTFMPVGTHANVRHVPTAEVVASGARVLLANTYHLYLRPGPEVMRHFGSVHGFMQWPNAVLTDSGGFQIFSLADKRELTEDAAIFNSPYGGGKVRLTPELSIEAQRAIGSDIAMVLDVCPSSTAPEVEIRAAMDRTHRWAVRSLEAHRAVPTTQALFAIVQGGVSEAFRRESAEVLTQHPFHGFAIGGLAVGETREELYRMCAYTAQWLPTGKPRYVMGVGTPRDLVNCVAGGADMFDCIIPTKMAQQGYAYTYRGVERLHQMKHRLSKEPVEEGCDCSTCRTYARGYVHHLFRANQSLGPALISAHNLRHFQRLMTRLRAAVVAGEFSNESRTILSGLEAAEAEQRPHFVPVTLESGVRAVRDETTSEVMHPGPGPWVEANSLYVEQLGLEARLRASAAGVVRVLDVGLGAAANALAAIECAERVGAPRARLVVVSLERAIEPLEAALRDGKFEYIERHRAKVEALLRDRVWRTDQVEWRLLVGDAYEALCQTEGKFDLVFHDPFSPEHNADLWTVEFFDSIRERCASNAELATYSAATPARVAMLLAGFYVGPGIPSGARPETTRAAMRADALPELLGERWLGRWERSSARSPPLKPFDLGVASAVRGHPQFRVRPARVPFQRGAPTPGDG